MNTKDTRVAINLLKQALKIYALHHEERWPTPEEGLQVLVERPPDDSSWKGPYTEFAATPIDAWGQPLLYQISRSTGKMEVRSIGRDRTPYTDDDIAMDVGSVVEVGSDTIP